MNNLEKNQEVQLLKKELENSKRENKILLNTSSSLDFDTVFQRIVDYLIKTYDFEGCGLYLVSHDKKTYTFEQGYDKFGFTDLIKSAKGSTFSLENNIGWLTDCMLNNKTLFATDLEPAKVENPFNRAVVETLKIKSVLITSLSIEGEIFGAFTLSTHSKSIYLENYDIEAIKRFANHIATVLRNSKLYQKIKRKNEEIESLAEISRQISMSLDFDTVFEKIVEYLDNTYGFEGCWLFLISDDKTTYRVEKHYVPEYLDKLVSSFDNVKFPLDPNLGWTPECMINNKTVYIPDVELVEIDGELNKRAIETQNIKTILILPITIEDEIIGTFTLTGHSKPIYLHKDDIESIKRFASQISVILRNSKLFEESKLKSKEIESLAEISRQISMSLDFDTVFEKIVEYLGNMYGFEGCWLFLMSDDRKNYTVAKHYVPDRLKELVSSFDNVKFPLDPKLGWAPDCMVNNKTVYIPDVELFKIEGELNKLAIETQKIKTILILPITLNDVVIGTFTLTSHSDPIYLVEENIESIKRFANQISVIIRNSKLYDEVKEKTKSLEKANLEIQGLNEITKEISTSLNFDIVFHKIVKYLSDTYGFEGCILALISNDKKFYKIEKVIAPSFLKEIEEEMLGKTFILNEEKGGRAATCILKNEISFFTDIDVKDIKNQLNKQIIKRQRLKSALNIPITIEDEVIGAFTLTSHTKTIYLDKNDIESIKRFVNQIGVIIRNSKLYDLIKDEVESLNEITKQISMSLDFETVFNRIVDYLNNTFGFEGCTLQLVNPDKKSYTIEIARMPEHLVEIANERMLKHVFPLNFKDGGRLAHCMLKNEISFFTDIKIENIKGVINRESVKALEMKSILIIPISIGTEVIGAFTLTSHSKTIHLNENDIETIKRFVNQISIIIRNSILYEEIEKERAFSNNLIETSPIAIQVINKKGEIIYSNPACISITNFIQNKKNDKNWLNFKSIKNTGLDQDFHKVLNGQIIYEENVNFQSAKTKKTMIMNITLSPVYDVKNNVENILVMYYDNTEKALAEKELTQALKDLIEKDRVISNDLFMAKKIQTNIISPKYKKIRDVKMKVIFEPMMEVGGDIYDIFQLRDKYYRIFIADATGHGVQAALTTMIIKTEYDKVKLMDGLPHIILTFFNNTFIKRYLNLRTFFTCIIIDIDLNRNKIYYSSAGHPKQFMISNNVVKSLDAGDMLIGIEENLDYELKSVDFIPEDKALFFTDGLFEEFNEENVELGIDRFTKMIETYKSKDIRTLTSSLIKDVKKWRGKNPPHDDITFIGIEFPKSK